MGAWTGQTVGMADFEVHLDPPLPAPEAWSRILDLRAHTAVIPLTTVTGYAMVANELVDGSRFVARTGLGPVGFDDVMVVEAIVPPTPTSAGRARIRKEGKVVRGVIDLTGDADRGRLDGRLVAADRGARGARDPRPGRVEGGARRLRLDAAPTAQPRLKPVQRQPSSGATCVSDALDDVRVVVDAELVGHGEQQRVGGGDRLVLGELLRRAGRARRRRSCRTGRCRRR